jgi:outer membrane lipase/esterase
VQAKGAKYIALMTLPDSAATPAGATSDDRGRALLTGLGAIFNRTLRKSVSDQALNLLMIDANAANLQVFANPAQFGVTNITTPACDLAKLPGASSLFCNATTLIPTANAGFLFADGVHPTTFGHRLFADYVTLQLAKAGWL